MRLRYVTLLLILLVVAGSATCSIPFRGNNAARSLRLQKRDVLGATTRRLLDAEVPDRFKKWSIFQDGNGVRERVRKGYAGMLSVVDRLHSPYPFSKGIEKKWIYMPDLRKHYVLPRVLRVPVILQDGPLRHTKPFKTFVKGANKDFGLEDTARKHIPDLDEEEKEAVKPTVRPPTASAKEVPAFYGQRGQRKSFSRRRRTHFPLRKSNFEHFRSAKDDGDSSPSTPLTDIDIRRGTPPNHQGSGPSRLDPSSDIAGQGQAAEEGPSEASTETGKPPSPHKLDNALIGMTDRFSAFINFKDKQLRKASIRYVGHPEYKAPVQQPQQEEPPIKEPGAGLAPIRTKPSASQQVTPDDTPRKADDPTDADADVSNPISPYAFFGESYQYNNIPVRPGSHEGIPGITTPVDVPSMRLSTPGDMSPGYLSSGRFSSGQFSSDRFNSRRRTPPDAEPSTGFRLPANYAELLHNRQKRLGLDQLGTSVSNPSLAHIWSVPSSPSRGVTVGWDEGRPSPEGLRELQEIADLYKADYAIYSHDARNPFHKAYGLGDRDQAAGSTPSSSKRKFPTADAEDQALQSFRNSASDLSDHHAQLDVPMADADPFSSSHAEPADVEMKDASPPNSNPSSPDRSPDTTQLGDEGPAKKRGRPPSLVKPLERMASFFFPTPKQSPNTPGMDGFKHSLKIEPGAALERSPSRQSLKDTVLSLKGRLKHLSTHSSPESTMRAFKESRVEGQGVQDQHAQDPRPDRLQYDPAGTGPSISAH
ncbi:uncharacterized protein SRS1_12972 [Sporisorium reilianum f. sp. reilianum]|uniref:Uncharacterized protein n=1 Tax=Sporisorium reilianum f. sp. reilianum TaxID=72559 RepID=A0A2N8UCQ2_9BASI|nr:uncharacterized protein SRS1_12972 [Sporisorium reilianum f. sp. reilianum]